MLKYISPFDFDFCIYSLAGNISCAKLGVTRYTVYTRKDCEYVVRLTDNTTGMVKAILVGCRETCPQHDDRRQLMDMVGTMLENVTSGTRIAPFEH